MTDMRDKIAKVSEEIMFRRLVQEKLVGYTLKTSEEIADAILAAMPSMIAPLVWEKHSSNATVQPKHFYSGMYSLIYMSGGYLVDFNDLSLGHGYSLGQAKSLADSHHRAAGMAAFTGETQ
jgi:hypothetical protein